jgi:hypothetical protein
VGGRCVPVIDTGGSGAEGRALHCAIRRHTPLPVCYVINTHVHPDHILGNRTFTGQGLLLVGHARLPGAMFLLGGIYLKRLAAGEAVGPQAMVALDRTVAREAALDLGGRRLRLTAPGTAHTDTDLSVYDGDPRHAVALGPAVRGACPGAGRQRAGMVGDPGWTQGGPSPQGGPRARPGVGALARGGELRAEITDADGARFTKTLTLAPPHLTEPAR